MNKNNIFYKRLEGLLPVILDKNDFRTRGLIAACASGIDMISAYLDEVYAECFVDTAQGYGLEKQIELLGIEKIYLPEARRSTIKENYCKSAQVRSLEEMNSELLKLNEGCYFTSDNYQITIHGLPICLISRLDDLGKFINKFIPPGVRVVIEEADFNADFEFLDSTDYTFSTFDGFDCPFSVYDTF